ncbi:MAG TPA: alpha-glucuronidase family glycosyl hydrolase, partial [Cyclobacteriaceae bacterium]|nr:alpha-glucuronidase family glycosyl hydrolase [Cyclobacteriaceae bacterium]
MRIVLVAFVLIQTFAVQAEDGYRLWLRYDKIGNTRLLSQYKKDFSNLYIDGQSATQLAIKTELETGLTGLLDFKPTQKKTIS